MHDPNTALEAAIAGVSQAAAVCRHVQRSLDEVRSITKDDRSPVTVADFAAQAIIGRTLRDRLGAEVRLVGEEDAHALRQDDHAPHRRAVLDAVRRVWPDASEDDVLDAIDVGNAEASGSFWTLDPVDGTKGFLRNQQYAIALAFIEDGRPVIGVMGCPNLPMSFEAPLDVPDSAGCLYACIAGRGVTQHECERPQMPGTPIRRDDKAPGEPVSVCASVEKAHSNVSDTDRILDYLAAHGQPTREPTRLDSQAKYAVVARGQADAYLRLPTRKGYVERIWDHAAGSLIATEAGCVVSDIAGQPLDFSQGMGLERNRGVICAPPSVHAKVIDAIRDLGIGSD